MAGSSGDLKESGMGKVIVRIRGGLGNQLFCYAAARRLALANNAELVIDDITGFVRDRQYGRRYMLDRFKIPARKATPSERLEPFERWRRGIAKWISRRKPFAERCYLEQEGLDFDERILALKVDGGIYLDGLWQGEGYFKDVEQTIRKDLRMIPPTDIANQRMAQEIRQGQAVALHVRWFTAPGKRVIHNVSVDYYVRAISLIEGKLKSPRYFIFSDDPEAARRKLALQGERITFVSHNQGLEGAYADLWLMSRCQHFIIANSTFSWWGAWLVESGAKIVVAPDIRLDGITAWGFEGLIPESWQKVIG